MNLKTIIGAALGLGFLYGLFTVGSPFLLAMVIAIFLEPMVRLFMNVARLNRMAASIIVCTLFTLLMLFMSYLLGAKVVAELAELMRKIPAYLNDANHYVRDAVSKTELLYSSLPDELAGQVQEWAENSVTTLTDALSGIAVNVSGYLIDAAKAIPGLFIWSIVFVIALYLLTMGLPQLKESFLSLFEERSRSKMSAVLDNLRLAIFGFLQAQIILAVLVYAMSLIGFIVLGAAYPMALALLVVVVDILPILGVGSVLLPWAVFSLITGNTYLGVGLIVMFLVISIVRRIVEPKVVGDAVGIGALAALVSLYVGFKLIGIVGLFLGPIVIIIYQAMRKVGLLQIKIKLE